ncbi:peptidase M18, aminopeptidase I [Ascobolus immersus RN42]|uniref:Peptidase M18, aminopeptidase I n=1 Tax=Ascobolus immersus RN42 TaxID=1160509 RepID=A0A3N4IEN2_ASCIM|nr:peptidase M18, aminopeptidase I [Ascobolus immersus RN42]
MESLSLADSKLRAASLNPSDFTKPFLDFMTNNPTVFHAVDYFCKKLEAKGFTKLSERANWEGKLKKGGRYYTTRNGSSLMAFVVGEKYKAGNGASIVVGHIDALTARLKPVSKKPNSQGYVQLGVAPYAGALNSTWWDRDLGVGGKIIVKENGKIVEKLVKLDWPIARIPTLAPHFGAAANGPFNKETNMVPIIGLESAEADKLDAPEDCFASSQPPRLVKALSNELGIKDYSSIINWDLELFDTQPAALGGLSKEFIFAGRIDDKLCSWAALEALLTAVDNGADKLGTLSICGLFDDEEIGSKLRQGAASNYLNIVMERVIEQFSEGRGLTNLVAQTNANSFIVSADVSHAVNPNFLHAYLPDHMPKFNVGITVCADSNGHMTTDAVSTSLFTRIAEKSDCKLQIFQIRNDSRSGGTVGPMLSAATGIRAIDAGMAQLSMHSIRATCGSLDPGLGVKIFAGFYEGFEAVDAEFEE